MIAGLILTIVLAAGPPPRGTPPRASPSRPARVDACALLTGDDIQRVLGQPVKEQQPNTQPSRGLLMSQCFFGTASARSVSLAVAAPTSRGRSSVTPRQYWKAQFHPDDEERSAEKRRTDRDKDQDKDQDKDKDQDRRQGRAGDKEREREGESSARPIPGVGDEAFWSGTRIAGALYVLKGDRFIRVSVGGIRDEAERIEKSKALARLALPRF